jgi:hypothetical protein
VCLCPTPFNASHIFLGCCVSYSRETEFWLYVFRTFIMLLFCVEQKCLTSDIFFGSSVTTKTLEGPIWSGDNLDLTFGVTYMKVVSLKITLHDRKYSCYSICYVRFRVSNPSVIREIKYGGSLPEPTSLILWCKTCRKVRLLIKKQGVTRGGGRGTAAVISNIDTKRRWVVASLWSFYLRERTPIPL